MTTLARYLLLAAASLAILWGILLAADGWGTPGAMRVWLREMWRGEHMKSARVHISRSTETTRGAITDLVEGRLSLREAAAILQTEWENRPPPFNMAPTPKPGESVEVFYLRTAVRLVEERLAGDPHRDEVVRRLRAELQAELAGALLDSPPDAPDRG